MNPVRELGELAELSHRRSAKLRGRVSNLQGLHAREVDAALTATTIDAAGLWDSFLRAYYLSIANRAWTRSGTRLAFAAGFPNADDAIRFAIRRYGKSVPPGRLSRRNDPAWHHLGSYVALLRSAGASNLGAVSAALGYPTLFFDHLTTVRNFYAHRCEETFNKAAQLGIQLGVTSRLDLHPNIMLTHKMPGASCDVITDWLYDIDIVIDDLCA